MELGKALDDASAVRFYAATDQGTREYQQDAAFAESRGALAMAILCDGMGGMNGGEKASNTGVGHFSRDFREAFPIKNIPEFLETEARRLDKMVYALSDEEGKRLKAGSTAVGIIIEEDRLYWMSVGDSRLYILRDGKLTCLTAAHNYKTMLQEKLADGSIDMDYYNAEISQGEALTSYLGLGNLPLIDVRKNPYLLKEDDMLLLCSDGLYKTLSDEQITALMKESGGYLNLAGERLLATAKRWGRKGQDNTTVILLKPAEKTGR